MVTFYSGATEARNVEHSNYKFGLDKTLSILFKSAEVSLLGSPLLIGFGLGFAEAEVLVQIKAFLRSCVPRGKAGRDFGFFGLGFFAELHEAPVESRCPQRVVISVIVWVGRVSQCLDFGIYSLYRLEDCRERAVCKSCHSLIQHQQSAQMEALHHGLTCSLE